MDAVVLLVLFVVVLLLIMRSFRRQRVQRDQVVSRLRPGARVMLSSGLLAEVVEVDGEEVVLDAGAGVRLRYVARAVAAVREDGPSQPPPDGNSDPPQDVTDVGT